MKEADCKTVTFLKKFPDKLAVSTLFYNTNKYLEPASNLQMKQAPFSHKILLQEVI
jgi:hypothetical protein